jgi:diacylglycerol kinase family enzyme
VAIAKGEQWGHPGLLPPGAPIASSDADAASYLQTAASSATRTIGLEAGDLARTLGLRAPYDPNSSKHLVPVDALEVELDDGSVHLAIAHVVIGSLRWRRGAVAIMNAAFIGTRNIAPRAHPGDGKVDVVHLDLDLSDRAKAWKRMATGTHVPHPNVTIRQRRDGVLDLDRSSRIHVDGRSVGSSVAVRYRVIPGAIVVAVS